MTEYQRPLTMIEQSGGRKPADPPWCHWNFAIRHAAFDQHRSLETPGRSPLGDLRRQAGIRGKRSAFDAMMMRELVDRTNSGSRATHDGHAQ